jgi:hypothetical protein
MSPLCQGLAKIKNYSFNHRKIGILGRFTNSSSMIDLKLIGVASTTASTPDFEAAFDGFAFHRLPKHGSTFKFHHGFVYTLPPGRPATLTKLLIVRPPTIGSYESDPFAPSTVYPCLIHHDQRKPSVLK